MERILIVNVNWLGDAIMTTPAFKAIKDKFPSAFIAVMAPERVKDVFSDNPWINEVIIFDEKKTHKGILRKLYFIKQLKKRNFDTVFLIHRSFTRALICFLAGIKLRIGYKRLKNMFIVNRMVTPPQKNVHKQDYYLQLFEKSGISINDKFPRVYVSQQISDTYKNIVGALRKKHNYLIGINPSANWAPKRWPAENFAGLSDALSRQLNCGIVIIGAKADKETVEDVISRMKETPYNYCAKTNIKELAAIISNLDLFISNDSGPAHLSASLGVNTIVLFGPTLSALSAPRGIAVEILEKPASCEIPCYNDACADNLCMKNITVEDVCNKAKQILGNV